MSVAITPVLEWAVQLPCQIYAIYLFWMHFPETLCIPAKKKILFGVRAILLTGAYQFIFWEACTGIASWITR
ncbi:MAG: hypothetical protein Q8922_11745 [Bacteroidota bacterium]|nr:hypothetical protein [Bacteroidota bacterium]MDP4234645.1 hypothetical protein [Bacteroidota bacterium]MDP4243810.1 hypothetical protein [Bacteroidota bacterium]MDP4288599.1 hypothetical protein [Bacteroidota bacterium]